MFGFLLALLLAITALCAGAEERVPRILIVGDSWAASIATQAVDVKGFGSFDAVLDECGLGAYRTEGATTAWGGRKASNWVKPEHLAHIDEALRKYPTIDLIHLIIGGNDFLALAAKGRSIASYGNEELERHYDTIANNIQAIVNHCLALRADVRVLISDYDYLDAAKAQAAPYGFDFAGATPKQLNEAFVALGRRKLAIAQRTDRCGYVSNWGVLQHAFSAAVPPPPLPGGPPDFTPYTGGDIAAPMPAEASVGDGIHPTHRAHRTILRRCMDQWYAKWLKPVAATARP